LNIHAPTQLAELTSLNEPGLEPVCVYARKALLIAQSSLQRLTNSLPAIEGFPERLLQLVYLDFTEAAFSEINAGRSAALNGAPAKGKDQRLLGVGRRAREIQPDRLKLSWRVGCEVRPLVQNFPQPVCFAQGVPDKIHLLQMQAVAQHRRIRGKPILREVQLRNTGHHDVEIGRQRVQHIV
jgi:hypothetical protein